MEVVGPCMPTGTQQGLCGGGGALYVHRDLARVVWRWWGLFMLPSYPSVLSCLISDTDGGQALDVKQSLNKLATI